MLYSFACGVRTTRPTPQYHLGLATEALEEPHTHAKTATCRRWRKRRRSYSVLFRAATQCTADKWSSQPCQRTASPYLRALSTRSTSLKLSKSKSRMKRRNRQTLKARSNRQRSQNSPSSRQQPEETVAPMMSVTREYIATVSVSRVIARAYLRQAKQYKIRSR